MSSLEHRELIEVETLKPYVPGGIEFVEVTLNKGRLPKAERTLTRRQRKELRNEALGNREVGSSSELLPMEHNEPLFLEQQELDGLATMQNPSL